MSVYFNRAYKNRLNRYGYDHQSRILGQREKVFQQYLLKSIYRVEFEYEQQEYVGTLERYKQDKTQTLQYLLVADDIFFDAGTILNIPNQSGEDTYWMIYWLEKIQSRGYNKYIVLKMSHMITWKGRDNNFYHTRGYFYHPDGSIKDTIKSLQENALYTEPTKTSSLIIPLNENINKDDYFEVIVSNNTDSVKQCYVVTGYDVQSTPGVEYVSVDPVYARDHTPAPIRGEEDNKSDFYWLEGGN